MLGWVSVIEGIGGFSCSRGGSSTGFRFFFEWGSKDFRDNSILFYFDVILGKWSLF